MGKRFELLIWKDLFFKCHIIIIIFFRAWQLLK